MDGQDWNPVVFRKSAPTTAATAKHRPGYQTGSELRKTQRGPVNGQRLAKIDRTEIGDLPKINKMVATTIAKARVAQGLSQKALAQAVNVKPEVIASYERGKAQPQQAILGKIQRKLGVFLSGKKIGEPLTKGKA